MRFEDYDIWARTVMGEARGESLQGQIAVAWVIRNRVEFQAVKDKPDWWGEGYEGVCLKPWQFSCWNHNDPNKDVILAATVGTREYARALGVCLLVASNDLRDPTLNATSYHTVMPPPGVSPWPPTWTRELVETTQVGSQVFYRQKAA